MSRTKKGTKGQSYDVWSRRRGPHYNLIGHGPIPKRITKRRERKRDQAIERSALENPEEFEGRIPGE